MAEAIGAGHAVIVLEVLQVLRLGWVLVLCMLLVAIEHVGHTSASTTIQPGAVALLMILRVHGYGGGGSSVLAVGR